MNYLLTDQPIPPPDLVESRHSATASVVSSKSSRDTIDGFDEELNYVIQEIPTTVVLPVDNSQLSEELLKFYIRFVHKIGNKVHVLYISEKFTQKETFPEPKGPLFSCCPMKNNGSELVRNPSNTKGFPLVDASPGVLAELERQDKTKCSAFKKKVKRYFRTNGVLFEYQRLISDDPGRAIIHFTKYSQAHLIIMSAKQRSQQSNLMGNISQKVIKLSTTPVIVVKHDDRVVIAGTGIN